MKQFILWGGIFSVFLTTALTACKKEIIATKGEAQKETILDERLGLTTDGKLLKFATLEAYEKAVDHEQAELQEEMLTTIKKASFPNYFSNSTVIEKNANAKEGQEMDDFLGQLLNKDGAVQIGEHIYKVDLQKEKVFVIEAKNSISDYSDLINGRTSNKNVKEFSTDDDVLYIVRDGASEKCGGIGTYRPFSTIKISDQEVYVFEHGNYKAGIYFNFKARMFLTEGIGITLQPFAVSMYYEIAPPYLHLKKRPCGNGDVMTFTAGTFSFGNSAFGSGVWTPYSGTRNLNEIYSKMRGKMERNGVVYYTNFTTISVNSPI